MKIFNNIIIITLFCVLLVVVLLIVSNPVYGKTPWEVIDGETHLTGLFYGFADGNILVEIENELLALTLHEDVLIALMGNNSGRLIAPQDLPPGIKVEIFISGDKSVRAIRNSTEPLANVKQSDIILPLWGIDAIFGQDEDSYLLYRRDGLFLCSISDAMPPLFLSESPLSDWSSRNIIASTNQEGLSLYDCNTNKQQDISLPMPEEGYVQVIIDLAWNSSGNKLLYSSLQDLPNICSDLFLLSVINTKGDVLNSQIVPNLDKAIWLGDNQVLYITGNDDNLNEEYQGILWDLSTNEKRILLASSDGGYRNITYNSKKGLLAYTLPEGPGQAIHILSLHNTTTYKLTGNLPYGASNLQWAPDNTLLFWEELNNVIFKIDMNDSIVLKLPGYLPSKGIGIKRFLYFAQEPIEEAQPIYLH